MQNSDNKVLFCAMRGAENTVEGRCYLQSFAEVFDVTKSGISNRGLIQDLSRAMTQSRNKAAVIVTVPTMSKDRRNTSASTIVYTVGRGTYEILQHAFKDSIPTYLLTKGIDGLSFTFKKIIACKELLDPVGYSEWAKLVVENRELSPLDCFNYPTTAKAPWLCNTWNEEPLDYNQPVPTKTPTLSPAVAYHYLQNL